MNDSGTDGRFFSWLGQFQWVRRVSDRNVVLASINTQLTPDSLLSLERFSIGGRTISKAQAKALSEHFKVSSSLFI